MAYGGIHGETSPVHHHAFRMSRGPLGGVAASMVVGASLTPAMVPAIAGR